MIARAVVKARGGWSTCLRPRADVARRPARQGLFSSAAATTRLPSIGRNGNCRYQDGFPASLVRWSSSSSSTVTNDQEDDGIKEAEFTTKSKTTTTPPPPPPPPPGETMEFQAETRQLLDIVTNSLYTDKEVFLRELVSNASDALEKLRHLQATNSESILAASSSSSSSSAESGDDAASAASSELCIKIDLDEVTSSITITDSGIGMTRDEMISNLGTIARSGSKNFLKQLQEQQQQEGGGTATATGSGADQNIIGKFGVGFYSAFMVANKVTVSSRSALQENAHEAPKVWTSDGSGTYDISDLADDVRQEVGSKIQIFLKSDYWNLVDEKRIKEILNRYSNFVSFPIYLNGNRVNTVQAIWTRDPKEVKEEEYTSFYKFISNAVDSPLDTYHFRADAPLDVKALFFIPSFHSEKYGMGRMSPGVSLYSRKILIEQNSPDILPEWLRFVKGVVDSEDLPLAISREKTQDSALIRKLRQTLTRKFLAHLKTMMKKDHDTYMNEFYKEYSFFLKEGICQDYENQKDLCKLLHFETSKNPEKDLISLDEYIGRMRPEQEDIYYLVAPSRDAALNSPYLEAFEKAKVEVLLLFSAIDDFCMANLENYEGRKLVSVEKGDIDLSKLTPSSSDDDDAQKDGDTKIPEDEDAGEKLYKANRALTDAETLEFCNWFRETALGEKKVASCTVTSRLTTSPAIVTDNESGAMRRLMRMVDTGSDGSVRDSMPLPKQHVEINPKHAVIVGIHDLMKTEPTLARVLAEQVFDNCLVAAGLLDDSRSMLPRLNDILLCVVNSADKKDSSSLASGATEDTSNSSLENNGTEEKVSSADVDSSDSDSDSSDDDESNGKKEEESSSSSSVGESEQKKKN